MPDARCQMPATVNSSRRLTTRFRAGSVPGSRFVAKRCLAPLPGAAPEPANILRHTGACRVRHCARATSQRRVARRTMSNRATLAADRSGAAIQDRRRPPACHRRGRSPSIRLRATAPMVRRWAADGGPEGRGSGKPEPDTLLQPSSAIPTWFCDRGCPREPPVALIGFEEPPIGLDSQPNNATNGTPFEVDPACSRKDSDMAPTGRAGVTSESAGIWPPPGRAGHAIVPERSSGAR